MARKKRKKTHRKSSKSSKFLTYLTWSLATIALLLSVLVAGYYFGYEEAKEGVVSQKKLQDKEKLALLKKLEKVQDDKKEQKKKEKEKVQEKVSISKEEDVKKRLKEVLKKPPRDYATASHEYEVEDSSQQPPEPEKREPKITISKPKLAIIIDDVSVRSHVEAIKSLKIPLTMSFLPPSTMRPNSAKLASKEEFYMVHLPMEAMSFSAEEPTTLRVKDSQQKISKRVESIIKLFPKVKYINNHTGSKFTSNEIAMNRLIYSLNQHKINFIDSRTTAQTKVPNVMKNFGLKYVSRDVFLDHHMDKPYVKNQIKEAIRIAKQHGTAVAIGHPHKNTILALKESRELLKDVELVYINKLN